MAIAPVGRKRWKISLAAIKVLLQTITLRVEQRKDDVIWRGVGAPTQNARYQLWLQGERERYRERFNEAIACGNLT